VSFRRLRVLCCLTGGTQGFLYPFLVLLLLDSGLDSVAIGTTLGAAAFVALVSYPTWGLLADGPLGRERSVSLAALLAAMLGACLLVVEGDPLLTGLVIALLPFGMAPWEPVADALVLQALGADASRRYGRFRLWTSLGWAISALVGGVLYATVGPRTIVLAFVAGSLLLAAVTIRPRHGRSWRRAGSTTQRQPLLPELRRVLIVAPVLIPLLVATFLEWLSTGAVSNFTPLRIVDIGGSAIMVGLASALPAIVEVPLFPATGWLSEWLGLRGLYVTGFVISVVVMLVIAVAQDPLLIAIANGLGGVSYVLRYTSVVLIVGAVLPPALRATGQSMTRLVGGGLAAIVAGPFAGTVYDILGGAALFLVCALLLSVGALVAWRGLRGPAFAPRRSTTPGEEAAT
jgi:PPP family 3-phenylpropionic acid transporter